MGINFHSEENRKTYTTRKADSTWIETINNLISIKDIINALDIGCGGGIYSKALSDMGINSVTCLDFSESILQGARQNCKNYNNISFKHGNASETGLNSNSYDLILERALIHHIHELEVSFKEAYRVLKEDGIFIIQDRTPEDCYLKGNNEHIRGFFFDLFPRLIEKETNRRHKSKTVVKSLEKVGFKNIEEIKLWETRQEYDIKEHLLQDLRERTGRSILHELNDKELNQLIHYIDESITMDHKIIEKDRWTIWKAVK